MIYSVKIDVFEGPFDLLLHLVKVNEMDVYDIRIAEITGKYLEYIKEMEKMDLEVAGDFLVMAATLIQLKTRTLVPPIEEDEEDEEEIDEEMADIRSAQDLMRRLIEYREFKELAVKLNEKEEEQLRLFYRNTVLPRLTDDDEDEGLREDINLLFSAFARVLDYTDGRPSHHVAEEEFHVEEKIESLKSQLAMAGRLSVTKLFERCINKQEIIALFLAMLEICRLRAADVLQSENYEEIYLVKPGEPEDDEEDL